MNQRLTNGDFAPLTDDLLLIEGDAELLADEFVQCELTDYPESRIVAKQFHGQLRDGLRCLLPLRWPLPNHWLFLPTTQANWTAVFHNTPNPGSGGAIGQLGVGLLLDKDRDSIYISATRGAAAYELNISMNTRTRDIRLLHDGDSYKLQESGVPFEFEDLASYKKRGRAKLTSNMIYGYVRKLELDWVWDEHNYAPDGMGWLVTSDFTNKNFMDIPFEQRHAEWNEFLASGEGLR